MNKQKKDYSIFSQRNILTVGLFAGIAACLMIAGCDFQWGQAKTDKSFSYVSVAVWSKLPDGMEFTNITGIDIDSQGRVYAAGGKEKAVLVFSPEGKLLNSWGSQVTAQHGLRIFNDRVWVTDIKRHQILEFTLDGKLIRSIGVDGKAGTGQDEFYEPTDVAIGANGDIYVSDGYGNSRIKRLKPDGSFLMAWGSKGTGPGDFNMPHNIAIDGKGRVYVADRGNSRVQVFDGDGKFLDEWDNLGRPFGLYIDDDQKVYVTDGDFNRVFVLNTKGEILTIFGEKGQGSGQLDMPHSIVVDKQGNVYTTEITNMRIQKFALQRHDE